MGLRLDAGKWGVWGIDTLEFALGVQLGLGAGKRDILELRLELNEVGTK